MTRPFIVGLRGVAGAGKTTLQNLTIKQSNGRNHYQLPNDQLHIYPYSFAKPIREGLNCMGITKQANLPLYRKAAQYLGTDLCRQLDPDWWTKLATEHFRTVELDIILIDDVRFPNEDALCDFIVFIEPGFPTLTLGDAASHESELHNTYRSGRIDLTITNELHNQHATASQLLETILTRFEVFRRGEISKTG